jgi:hypothetical protein
MKGYLRSWRAGLQAPDTHHERSWSDGSLVVVHHVLPHTDITQLSVLGPGIQTW